MLMATGQWNYRRQDGRPGNTQTLEQKEAKIDQQQAPTGRLSQLCRYDKLPTMTCLARQDMFQWIIMQGQALTLIVINCRGCTTN